MSTKVGFLNVKAKTGKGFRKALNKAAKTINDQDGSILWTDTPKKHHIVITYQYDEDDGDEDKSQRIGF